MSVTSHPGDASAPPRRPRPVRATRVLIADDTPDIRLMLRIALQARDDVELVGEARNGREAIELTAALRPDLLVLDIGMPVLDGIAALPALRRASPETRVVVLTAISSHEHRAAARAGGAVAYVEKTTSIRVLVDELLRGADLLDAVLDIVASPTFGGVREMAGDVAVPAHARRFVVDTLDGWGESALHDVVELLVSELVSNVVRHTGTAPQLSVRLTAERVHVEVVDADPRPPEPRDATSDETGGRGLALVESLAADWGWTPLGHGKVVWFDLARDAAGTMAHDARNPR